MNKPTKKAVLNRVDVTIGGGLEASKKMLAEWRPGLCDTRVIQHDGAGIMGRGHVDLLAASSSFRCNPPL